MVVCILKVSIRRRLVVNGKEVHEETLFLCYILLCVNKTLVKGLKNYKQLHRNTVVFVLFVPTFTRVTITFLIS